MYKLSIALLIGFAFFATAYLRGRLRGIAIGFKSAIWLLPYLGGLSLISYLGAFGGKGVIPFGWDFLVLGVFSLAMLYLAVWTRSGNTQVAFHNQQLAEMPSIG